MGSEMCIRDSDNKRFANIGDGMEAVGRVVLTSVSAFEMTDVRSHGLTASADSMNLPLISLWGRHDRHLCPPNP